MLTKIELDFLSKIPEDKKVSIHSFDPKVIKIAEDLIQSIKNIYPELEVKHLGASALGISGQNDIDVYAFSDPSDFEKYLTGLTNLFGKPLHQHKTFIEWKFNKNRFDIEFYLTFPDLETMKKQIAVIEILKNNKGLLKKYEKLKESMNGKSFREYQEKKYEFYHRILDNKIKAILFDLVGVLVFKREGYIPTTPNEINAQNIENLFNHIDDQRLLRDIKDKLDLNDGEIKKALPYIPSKFEKFDYSIFDLYINSGEIGLRKPDPKIYLLTCDKLRVKLDECLFMDDSLENIDSAKKLGMKTIWWNRNENKEKLLLKRSKNKKIDPGVYSGVGGKVEPHESFYDALLREIKEETGLIEFDSIKPYSITQHPYPPTDSEWVNVYFNVNIKERVKIPPSEDGSFDWIDPKDVSSLPMVADLKEYIGILIENPSAFIFGFFDNDESGKPINKVIKVL